jgi:hypothetical protein
MTLSQESDLDYIDFSLSGGSPAIGSGVWNGITTDFTGAPRNNPPARGALEPGSTFNIQEYIV